MKVMGTTNVISTSDTTIKAMAVADNCTCGWGTIEQRLYNLDRMLLWMVI